MDVFHTLFLVKGWNYFDKMFSLTPRWDSHVTLNFREAPFHLWPPTSDLIFTVCHVARHYQQQWNWKVKRIPSFIIEELPVTIFLEKSFKTGINFAPKSSTRQVIERKLILNFWPIPHRYEDWIRGVNFISL